MVRKVLSVLRRVSNRGYTMVITLPSKLVLDSKFPFKPNEQVLIEIDEWTQTLVIKKAKR